MSVTVTNQTRLFVSVAAQPGNFGATVFNALFAHYGINAVYLPRTAPGAKELADALRTFQVAGCSVSMPLKSAILPHLDEISEEARQIQSVNTVTNHSGRLTGYNTDYFGCREVLRGAGPLRSLLVYGSGSVVQSVVFAAKNLGIPDIRLCGRNPQRTFERAEGLEIQTHSPGQSGERFDLLINATPSGDDPGDGIRPLLEQCSRLFDLRVRAAETPLEIAAREKGLPTVPGVEMAKFQLQKQFELYVGIFPPVGLLEEVIRQGFLGKPVA